MNSKNQRRTRIDSAAAKAQVLEQAERAITPPPHVKLKPGPQLTMFNEIVEEFARSELTPHKLSMVAFLARDMAALEDHNRAIDAEGMLITTRTGRLAANPRLQITHNLRSSILSLRRSLALHGRATHGDNRLAAKRRAQAKEIEEQHPGDESLIQKPKIH